jgi:hypothetical protein
VKQKIALKDPKNKHGTQINGNFIGLIGGDENK